MNVLLKTIYDNKATGYTVNLYQTEDETQIIGIKTCSDINERFPSLKDLGFKDLNELIAFYEKITVKVDK
jgi:hypothetical protein